MELLFAHQSFPAQFGRIALELSRRYGWHPRFISAQNATCPPPSADMLKALDVHYVTQPPGRRANISFAETYSASLEHSYAVLRYVQEHIDRFNPDLIVSHSSLGMSLFLPEVLDCPSLLYCEYYYQLAGSDISYRRDLPLAGNNSSQLRIVNAMTLTSLVQADRGYSPTIWQKESFPGHFHHKIDVCFDGIDTVRYSPGPTGPRVIGGKAIPDDYKIITYVSRGLESMRGFDMFMRIAKRISQRFRKTVFVIVGSDRVAYSPEQFVPEMADFKRWVLGQDSYDQSRFIFTGQVDEAALVHILRLSDLHVYLTAPFALSWSLFNAMSCGCIIMASDSGPVKELIRHYENGVLVPFHDVDRAVKVAVRVLKRPGEFAHLRASARETIEEKYSLDVVVPKFRSLLETMAG